MKCSQVVLENHMTDYSCVWDLAHLHEEKMFPRLNHDNKWEKWYLLHWNESSISSAKNIAWKQIKLVVI